ncbi:putative Pisatin demethylase [Glarea lozoyensis 74030]|uniref:Putative Pisatin demethylase n=1 Tax=Glarea lozoyensis (strain ATCC 74030 / MF5533) TaxID=1104152 RepID=H0EI56_GLAL7|nr:putative Pisatin demethylase [Glarea lozoyensis 74030]
MEQTRLEIRPARRRTSCPDILSFKRVVLKYPIEFWRPERWLEKDDAHKRRLEQGVLTFGAGRRVCLGKHIGILEIKKLIPFLILNYDIRIIDREKFQVENSWFLFQTGLYAQLQKRPESRRCETIQNLELDTAGSAFGA